MASRSTFRVTRSSSSRGSPARESRLSPSTSSMPRGSGVTSTACPPTLVNSSRCSPSPTWSCCSACLRRSRSSSAPAAAAGSRPSRRSPRFTTICGCCTRKWASSTARVAIARSIRRLARQIWERLQKDLGAAHGELLAPVVRGRKGFHKDVLQAARKLGCEAARVDGRRVTLDPIPKLARFQEHDIDAVVAEVSAREDGAREALDRALRLGAGHLPRDRRARRARLQRAALLSSVRARLRSARSEALLLQQPAGRVRGVHRLGHALGVRRQAPRRPQSAARRSALRVPGRAARPPSR